MFLVMQMLGPYGFQAGAFDLETSIKLNLRENGKTVVHLPPLGRVTAFTHYPPLDLHFVLKNINLDALESLDALSPSANLPDLLVNDTKIHMVKYFIFLLLLSFCLGTGSALLWGRQRVNKIEALHLGLVNVLVLTLLLSFSVYTYDTDAFSRAGYEGMLEAAPLVMGVMEEGHKLIGDLGLQFGAVVSSASMLQREIETTDSFSEKKDTFCLLHVSDIHNNPAAFNLMRRVLETYNVDLIIDTGDLVDFGTSLELKVMEDSIRSFPVPYIFVPGNHDSPAVVDQLKTIENVTVLEAGVVEREGLRIAAIADPSSYYPTSAVSDAETLEETARKLQKLVDREGRIDIIAAHNPEFFRFLRRDGNLLLGGHMHSPQVFKGADYIEINAGSSGASGIRGLQKMEMQYSLVLIHFVAEEQDNTWRPYAADLVAVKQFPLHFSFERFILEN
ncbi:MAG: metallophosphoesterase [Bacillota bacterium]